MKTANNDERIGAFFDQCAQQKQMYDFTPEEQKKLERFFELWAIAPGSRVLEPGCGAGRLTLELARKVGPLGEVYACDLSAQMIALARERGLPRHAFLFRSSAERIERFDGWFDRIVCLNVFPHLSDKAGVLREFARVLKKDGQLWINHFEGREGLNHFHQHAAPEVAGDVLPCPTGMGLLMSQSGFRIVELTDAPEGYSLKAVLQADETLSE